MIHGLGLSLGLCPSKGVVLPLPNFASLAGFGDSIMAGQVASTAANQHINIFASARGAGAPLNKGIPGTVLQNSADAGGSARASNGRDRFAADLLGANKCAGVVLAYGFNDARYTGAPGTFNVTQYGVDYREILNGLLAGGYARTDIFIYAPYYITDTGLATGSTGFTGQTRVGFEAFVSAARAVATEYGTYFYDAYAYMRDHGYAPSGDNIHPDDTGHAIIAAGAELSTILNNKAAPGIAASSGSLNTISLTITPPSSGTVTNYTVEYGVDGAYTFPNTMDTGSLTPSWTGVSVGLYRARVRANFSDGSFSPWVFSGNVGVAGAGTFVFDTFSAASGAVLTSRTGEIGASWSLQTGSAPATPSLIDAAQAVYATAATSIYQASGVPDTANYYVEADLVFRSTLAGDGVAVAGRMAAAANTFYWAGWSQSSGGWRLFKTVAGTNTQLGSTSSDTFSSGTKKVRLTMNGSTISMSVNGVEVVSVTDTAITAAGRAGIRQTFAQGLTTGIHIDNFNAVNI